MTEPNPCYIVEAKRSAIGRFGGSLKSIAAADLAARVAEAVVPSAARAAIDQVILERLLTRRRQALRLLSLQQAAPILTVDPEKDARRIRILWEVVGA